MATKQSTIDYIVDQISSAGEVSSRKMFGEYALYCDGKVIAFVCDDKLFIKPTKGGETFLKKPKLGHAYPGSKLYFEIDPDLWDDRHWLTELVQITTEEVPLPKPKKKKK